MMKKEFEEIAGYEVSYEDYSKIIEPMYMATNLSKKDFIATLDKKRFALPTKKQMMSEIKKMAKHLREICGHCRDHECEEKLDRLAKEYAKRFYGLDWSNDMDAYVFFTKGYECESLMRGCTYPKELVIGRGYAEYERIRF